MRVRPREAGAAPAAASDISQHRIRVRGEDYHHPAKASAAPAVIKLS